MKKSLPVICAGVWPPVNTPNVKPKESDEVVSTTGGSGEASGPVKGSNLRASASSPRSIGRSCVMLSTKPTENAASASGSSVRSATFASTISNSMV
ncbi:hypothetical protein D3C83_35380 [compost metagenome]